MKREIVFESEDLIVEHLIELDGQDPAEAMQQILHDCPQCRAELARGEKPVTVDLGTMPPPPRDLIRDRRPRWRQLKRRARR